MSVENKELINNLTSTKDLLEEWNINKALNLLNDISDNTVDFNYDLSRVWLEIMYSQSWEKWEEFTSWVNNILSQFLVQNNNIA